VLRSSAYSTPGLAVARGSTAHITHRMTQNLAVIFRPRRDRAARRCESGQTGLMLRRGDNHDHFDATSLRDAANVPAQRNRQGPSEKWLPLPHALSVSHTALTSHHDLWPCACAEGRLDGRIRASNGIWARGTTRARPFAKGYVRRHGATTVDMHVFLDSSLSRGNRKHRSLPNRRRRLVPGRTARAQAAHKVEFNCNHNICSSPTSLS
jgi:hypothetical protein